MTSTGAKPPVERETDAPPSVSSSPASARREAVSATVEGYADDDEEGDDDDPRDYPTGGKRTWAGMRSGPARTWLRGAVPGWAVAIVFAVGVGIGALLALTLRSNGLGGSGSAKVAIETEPPGAQVIIDGVLRGESPVTIDVPAGERVLSISRAGVRRDAVLRLQPGADVVRFFELEPPKSDDASIVALGSLEVQTRPAGARVTIGGQARGSTPVTVPGLPAGAVDVTLTLGQRTVTQRVEIHQGLQALLVVPMQGSGQAESGWVAVRSAVPLRILEGGKVVGTTESERLMLPAGRHDLEFVNEQLQVRVARTVGVQGGRELSLVVPLPSGQVSLNAQPWAEVWLRGDRLGETPLGNIRLPVGQHELVFRHPQLGERRQTVTVRAATPTRVAVAFQQ